MLDFLLTPARRFSRRLTFRNKFILIFCVALIPGLLLTGLNLENQNANIQRDELELQGAAYIEVISPLAKQLALHRGLTTRALSGTTGQEIPIAEAATKVDEMLATIRQTALPFNTDALRKEWQAIEAEWAGIRTGWKQLSPLANITTQSLLIQHFNEYRHHIAGQSGLLLDPEAAAYFQIVTLVNSLPALQEQLGQLRAQFAIMAIDPQSPKWLGIIETMTYRNLPALIARIDKDLSILRSMSPQDYQTHDQAWIGAQQDMNALRDYISREVLDKGEVTDSSVVFQRVTASLEKLAALESSLMQHISKKSLPQRIAQAHKLMWLTSTLFLVMFTLVGWLILGFSADVIFRAKLLRKCMGSAAEGDFTSQEAIYGRDELSQVGNGLVDLCLKLGNTLREVRHSSDALLKISTQVASSSVQVASATQTESHAASSMASAVEQLTVSINQVAASAADAQAVSEESRLVSQEGGVVIQQTVSGIQGIADTVKTASGSVMTLGKQATDIFGVVNTIKEIADQTNLLALNAAIEAARAGESGRGFAVVADEVRKLAERTTTSTQQISATIADIQRGTRSAVDDMNEGVELVEEGVAIANKAGTAMRRIRTGSDRVLEVVADIGTTLQQQSSAAHDVARQVETIAEMSRQNNIAAQEGARAGEELRTVALALEGHVKSFRF